jgi:hypothetical protein
MSSMRLSFTWSDAWVLAAIAIASEARGATLKELIATGDSINGTLFTPKELRCGLAKLTRAGYAQTDGHLFSVAGGALDAAKKILKVKGTSFCVMLSFEGFLNVDPYAVDEKDQDWPFQGLSDEVVIATSARYKEESRPTERVQVA